MSSEATNRHSMEEPFREEPTAGLSDASLSDRDSDQVPRAESDAGMPPQPEDIRVPGVPALISWVDSGGQERFFVQHKTEVFIQYHTEPVNTIFIRLQCKVAQPSRHGTKHLFVFIRPQYVHSLSVTDESTLPPNVRDVADKAMTSNGAWCMSFSMLEPGALVLPKDMDPSRCRLEASTNYDAQQTIALLVALQELLVQKSFRLRIPHPAVAKNPLLFLCKALSTPGLLTTNTRLDDLNSLYGGRGGKIIEPSTVHAPEDAGKDDAPPPTYEAVQASVPSATPSSSKATTRRKKRRRETPRASESPPPREKRDASPVTLEMITSRIDSLIDVRIDERIKSRTDDAIHARIDEQILSHVDQLIDTRLGRRVDAAIELRLAPMESKLANLEFMSKRSKVEFDDLRYEFEKDVQDLREETEEMLTIKFEEEISEAKKDIHDYARGQVEDAKKDIVRQLRKDPLKCVVNVEYDSS